MTRSSLSPDRLSLRHILLGIVVCLLLAVAVGVLLAPGTVTEQTMELASLASPEESRALEEVSQRGGPNAVHVHLDVDYKLIRYRTKATARAYDRDGNRVRTERIAVEIDHRCCYPNTSKGRSNASSVQARFEIWNLPGVTDNPAARARGCITLSSGQPLCSDWTPWKKD